MTRAAENAGLNCLRIISEPNAAIMAAGYLEEYIIRSQKVMVFDLGHKTCNISVVQIDEGELNIEGELSDPNLGGHDIDVALAQYCMDKFNELTGACLIYHDPDNKQKSELLVEQCELAKKALQTSEETTVSLPSFHEGQDLEVTVSRDQLKEQAEETLTKIRELVERVIEDSYIDGEEYEILLVGGSTRLHCVREKLQEVTGQKLNTELEPDTAIAKGATLMARSILDEGS